jgi:transcriptional regulator with XRE-family HTH domain
MIQSSDQTFSRWLATQLRSRRMTQRQLAHHSGVDHSTISRLLRGDRRPSLPTAVKLARALRSAWSLDDETLLEAPAPLNPIARVEYAIRADGNLSESDVRDLMSLYLRRRTQGRRSTDRKALMAVAAASPAGAA